MPTAWLPGAKVVNLSGSMGNGPFASGAFRGVVLHVNVAESGTPDSYWQHNPNSVCPNFQIFKGPNLGNAGGYGVHQFLPFNWQPWAQEDGNYRYAAIETAGETDEPFTDYQVEQIGRIVAVYHSEYGMPLQMANTPGQWGLGTHAMGGAAWGGHPCPGSLRTAQRQDILLSAQEGEIVTDDDVNKIANAVLGQMRPFFLDDDGAHQHRVSYFTDQVKNAVTAAQADVDAKLAALTAAVQKLQLGSLPSGDVPATIHFGGDTK